MKQKIVMSAVTAFTFALVFTGCYVKTQPSTVGAGTSAAAAPAPASAPTTSIDQLDKAILESSDYLNERVPQGSKVAFVSAQQEFPKFSGYVVDGLIANAVNDRVFTVVDRAQLDAIRSEMSLQMSGAVSDSTVLSIGRILGVNTIVTVTVSQLGGMYRIGVRALEVESAEIRGQVNRNIPSDHTITALAVGTLQTPTVVSPIPPAAAPPIYHVPPSRRSVHTQRRSDTVNERRSKPSHQRKEEETQAPSHRRKTR